MSQTTAKKRSINLTEAPRSVRMGNDLLLGHYRKLNEAKKQNKPIVWASIDVPAFILWSMDIVPVFPQVHAAFQAQRRAVKKMMGELESKWEIPHNICGEVKGIIGSILCDNEVAFDIPKPDLLITANSSCGQVTKGFRYLQDYMGVDLLQMDFPFVYGKMTDNIINYSLSQFDDVIKQLEQRFGTKFSREKLEEQFEITNIFSKLWSEICDAGMLSPAPIDALDLFFFTSSFLTVDTDYKFLDVIVTLYNEVYEQVERNKKLENEEKFRVFWHYLPIYSKKSFFKDLFFQNNTTLISGTYLPFHEDIGSTFDYNFKYPITREQLEDAKIYARKAAREEIEQGFENGSLMNMTALSMLEGDVNRSIKFKYEKIKRMLEKYKIDGVIMHNDRSCRPQSLPQFELRRLIMEDLNIPVLYFDSDTMDERYFSESQITTRFEAFIEKMKLKKG